MSNFEAGLDGKQLRACYLIALGWRDKEVADDVGVSFKTVNRWRNTNEEFQATVEKVKNKLVSDLYSSAINIATKSFLYLNSILDSEEADDRLKVRVALGCKVDIAYMLKLQAVGKDDDKVERYRQVVEDVFTVKEGVVIREFLDRLPENLKTEAEKYFADMVAKGIYAEKGGEEY